MLDRADAIVKQKSGWLKKSAIFYIVIFSISISCKKEIPSILPEISTKPVSVNLDHSAESGGVIGVNGNVDIISRGVVWDLKKNTTLESNVGYTIDGEGTGEFNSKLISLVENRLYYLRAYARTNSQTIYGNEEEFIVLYKPLAYTDTVSAVACDAATLNGFVNANFSPTIISFEIGSTSDYGLIFSNQIPLQGNTTAKVSLRLTGLLPTKTYHYRIKAESKVGIFYGKDIVFSTKDAVSDIDGYMYSVIKIGTQKWLMENLKTTRYSNGDKISNMTDPGAVWLNTGIYWDYNDNSATVKDFGRLYNYYAAIDSRNICPVGWHVPSYEDLSTLINYLGGKDGGGKLKESGFANWESPNSGATNEYEFTAMPGGMRNMLGVYQWIGSWGGWWSSNKSYFMALTYNASTVNLAAPYDNGTGMSVRCIKGIVPYVKILDATDIWTTTATLNAMVKANDLPANAFFEYGEGLLFNNSIPATESPILGNSLVGVSCKITDLIPGKTYNYRIKGISEEGVSISESISFRTLKIPSAATGYAIDITDIQATIYGKVVTYGTNCTVKFEYGTTTNYDNEVVIMRNYSFEPPLIKTKLMDLTPETLYHFRIVAEDITGTSYGNDRTFKTANNLKMVDADGYTYNTVTIANQTWITENLNTTHYQNQDLIPSEDNRFDWRMLNYGADFVLSTVGNHYGKLYNFYAITDPRKLCPAGWHVPDFSEWNTLFKNVNDPDKESLHLKEPGNLNWINLDPDVTNSSGFTALPSGYVTNYGDFAGKGRECYWWSSTDSLDNDAYFYSLQYNNPSFTHGTMNKRFGFSVRCLKDN